tara:strand:- start:1795 stop:1962 length:168 start_codon:yes stop_codon:yes gene_type:complete
MKIRNIEMIPVTGNSKEIKFINRFFFKLIANFLKKLDFIDAVIVSRDTQIILNKV